MQLLTVYIATGAFKRAGLSLKRSLSFKTIMRSKSVENFFQRSNTPSPNPSLCSHSPSLSPSLSSVARAPGPQITHSFQEHVFRKPTSCQHCKQMIVGNSKQALRCRTCKIAAHLWCTSELSQQLCHGKSGAFKRNFTSPMLINDQLAIVKEAQPSQGKADRHPVYAALRYGTSLAQMSRPSFGSMSESPTRSLVRCQRLLWLKAPTHYAGEEQRGDRAEVGPDCRVVLEVHSVHTYVALYRFMPQEQNDLELNPGDRVQVTDDSNEEWWKGKSGDKVGFFPTNFVQRVRPGERVWRVTQSIHGNRERGHMPVKEDQICVGKQEDSEGYMRLSSGKKRGLVPAESIEEI
uniref:SH3 and cysteine rich domain 2 n=1 Tax=Gadus morhua TaxID=8049 RepID=A0A8C4YT10_GADMO